MATLDPLAAQAAYMAALKQRVWAYLTTNGLRQKDLAARMGITPQAVSLNLRAGSPMSEGFIRMLSDAVPEFADAIHDYARIKNGTTPTPAQRTAAEIRKLKAERIRLIRETEKEMLAGVRRLFEELQKIVDSE